MQLHAVWGSPLWLRYCKQTDIIACSSGEASRSRTYARTHTRARRLTLQYVHRPFVRTTSANVLNELSHILIWSFLLKYVEEIQLLSYWIIKLSLCFNWVSHHESILGEWKYSSTHSLTSTLDGGEWSASRPGRFTPKGKKPWYPMDRRLSGSQIRSGRGGEKKNS
jgi:hypothetical protein